MSFASHNFPKQQEIESLRACLSEFYELKKINKKENGINPVRWQHNLGPRKHQVQEKKKKKTYYCQYSLGCLNFMHCDFNNFSISHLISIKGASFKSRETAFHALQFH